MRYSDLDTFGHVNNAVYGTYVEEARVDYFDEVVDLGVDDLSGVVAHLSLDFERPVTDRGTVTVAVGVPRVGETSLPTAYELRHDGDVVATAESVQVVVDPETREPERVPDPWRERIVAHEPHLSP